MVRVNFKKIFIAFVIALAIVLAVAAAGGALRQETGGTMVRICDVA